MTLLFFNNFIIREHEFDIRMDLGFLISSENDDSYKNEYIYVRQI
ncbi:Integrase [Bacillus pseudomycoides DSM 12442]|nr:Integrase [Bacillus pseudomycoides DSM 12442]